MTWKRISRMLTLGILSTVVVAHLLFVVSLVGFGLRSDGWVLHPIGIAWYGLCVVGGCRRSLLRPPHHRRSRLAAGDPGGSDVGRGGRLSRDESPGRRSLRTL